MNNNRKGKLVILFGGQFGSEGKGEIAGHLAQTTELDIAVRVGGPNAGHTATLDGTKLVVQTVPLLAMLGATGVIGPGGAFEASILKRELEEGYRILGHGVKLHIDGNAAEITSAHMATEAHLKGNIGSTGKGVGAATAEKIMREPTLIVRNRPDFIKQLESQDTPRLTENVSVGTDTPVMVNRALLDGKSVMIEGTQGEGLSLHTGNYYPFCTSREISPQGLLADTGINPANAREVETIMVVRTFPIRVAGNSGPLYDEVDWEYMDEITNGAASPEITTVTKKVRRIGKLDLEDLVRTVLICRPTCLAVTFLDYTHPDKDHDRITESLELLESELQVPIHYYSTGPGEVYRL